MSDIRELTDAQMDTLSRGVDDPLGPVTLNDDTSHAYEAVKKSSISRKKCYEHARELAEALLAASPAEALSFALRYSEVASWDVDQTWSELWADVASILRQSEIVPENQGTSQHQTA